MVAHALMYWPNVGPSLPQPPNLTSLRKLQYLNVLQYCSELNYSVLNCSVHDCSKHDCTICDRSVSIIIERM